MAINDRNGNGGARPSNGRGNNPERSVAHPSKYNSYLKSEDRQVQNLARDYTKLYGITGDLREEVERLGKAIHRANRTYADDIEYRSQLERQFVEDLAKRKNAIIADDKAWKTYTMNRRKLQASLQKETAKSFNDEYELFQKNFKKQLTKINDLQEKYGKAGNAFTSKLYDWQLKSQERTLKQMAENISDRYEEIEDNLSDFDKKVFKKTLKDLKKQLEDFTDDATESWEKQKKSFKNAYGEEDGGILSQLSTFVNRLGQIELAESLNLSQLTSELTSGGQSRMELANELYTQRGIDPSETNQWLSDILNISNEQLKGTITKEQGMDIIRQLSEMDIVTPEDIDAYTETYLRSRQGLQTEADQMRATIQLDKDLDFGGELYRNTSNQIAALIHSGVQFQTSTGDLYEAIGGLQTAAQSYASFEGLTMSPEQYETFSKIMLSEITASEDALSSGALTNAFTEVTKSIIDNTVYTDEGKNLAVALGNSGLNLQGLREALMSSDEATAQGAANAIMEAVVKNASQFGTGSLNSLWGSEAGLQLEAISSEDRDAIRAKYNMNDPNGVQKFYNDFDAQLTAAQNAIIGSSDQSLTDTLNNLQIGFINEYWNKIGNWWDSGPGSFFEQKFGELGLNLGTISDILLTMNALLGKDGLFSTIGSWFGKGKGGSSGSFLSKGVDFVKNLFGKGKGAAAAADLADDAVDAAGKVVSSLSDDTGKVISSLGDEGLKGIGATIDDYAKLWGSTPSTIAETAETTASKVITGLGDEGLMSIGSSVDDYAKLWGSAPSALAETAEATASSGATGLLSKIVGGAKSFGGKALGFLGKAAPWLSVAAGGVDAVMGATKAQEWTGESNVGSTVASSIGGFLGGTGNGLKEGDFLENAMEIGGGALKGAGIGAAVGSVVPVVGNAVGAAVGAVVGGISSAIGGDTISQWINSGIHGIQDMVTGAGNWIAETAGNVGNWVSDTAGKAGEWLKGGAENVIEGFKEGGPFGAIKAQQENLYNAVKGIPVIGDFVQGAENVFQNIAHDLSQTPVGQAVTGFVDGIKTGAENVKNKIGEFAGNVWQGAQDIAGKAWQGAQDIAGKAWQGAQNLWGQLVNSPVGQGVQQFAGMISQGAQDVWNNITTFSGNLWQGAQDVAGAVGSFVGGIWDNVSNWWGGVTENVGNWWNGVTEGVSNWWGGVTDAAGQAWNGVTGAASAAGSYLVGLTQDPSIRNNPAGSHAGGLSEVPYDNYAAILHKGEAVLTADQANAVRSDGGLQLDEFIKYANEFNESSRMSISELSDSLSAEMKSSANLSQRFTNGNNAPIDSLNSRAADFGEGLRSVLYGNNTNGGNLYSLISSLSDNETEYFTKSIKFDDTSVGILKKMSPTVNRLANQVWTGTYSAKSEFKSSAGSTPSTKPAGEIQNKEKSLIDELTPDGEITNVDASRPNLFVDENGNQFVKNPDNGVVAPVTPAEEAVRPKGSYATGTPFLPQDEVALIHQGEMIVPADKNPLSNSTTTNLPISDNSDIVDVLRWLGDVIIRKTDEIEQIMNSSNNRVPTSRPYQGPSMTDIAFRY